MCLTTFRTFDGQKYKIEGKKVINRNKKKAE